MKRAPRLSEPDPTVIAFDPGGTSGWAVLSVHPEALVCPDVAILDNMTHESFGQITGDEFVQVDEMIAICQAWPSAVLVTEHFILQKFRQDENLLSLVRLNSALRYGLYAVSDPKVRRRVYRQNAALAMTTITDERLRRLGYWERSVGQPHARDAIRHGLTFLRRLKTQDSLLTEVFPLIFDVVASVTRGTDGDSTMGSA